MALWLPVGVQAQSAYEHYIDKYADMAVDQMKRYGIPASITLAQGLLESSAGKSRLATKGNNHFGIKCGRAWKGPYMLVNDDAPNEKFRVYRNAKESYEDHSKFLKNGKRYAFLFDLDKDDYKGWARGLKKAGYATNPAYANSLISLIERFNLDKYDKAKRHKKYHHKNDKEEDNKPLFDHVVRRCNGQYYVIARRGDTFESLAKTFDTKASKLREYNDVDKAYRLKANDIVYLGKKNKKADALLTRNYHIMRAGESLHGISQRYGIRLTSLCKLNPMKRNEHFKVGDRIRLK